MGGAGHKVMLLMEGKAHAYVFPSPGDIIHIIQAIISSAGDIIHNEKMNARKISVHQDESCYLIFVP